MGTMAGETGARRSRGLERPRGGRSMESENSSGAEGTSSGMNIGLPLEPLESMFDQAVDAEKSGIADKSIHLYRAILRYEPSHVRARSRLGNLLDRAGEHATALEHFRAALEVEPQNPAVLANLGAALGNLGRYGEAEAHLLRAMELDPESTEAALQLGILHFRRGLYTRAEIELARVIRRDADLAPAHLFRGKALNRLGRLDEALTALGIAARLLPDDPGTFHLMGILYDKKNLPREAQVMYRRSQLLSRVEAGHDPDPAQL